MNKRKLLTLALTLCMVAILAIGGTLAYFTDTDSAKNTMVLGKVDIQQNEYEWNDDESALKTFTQDKPLLPYVGKLGWENTEKNGVERRFTMDNVVDKYITVENIATPRDPDQGERDAYVRTIIAIEAGEDYMNCFDKLVGISNNSATGSEFKNNHWIWDDAFYTDIEGKNFYIMTATYDEALAPQEETIPSLLQVYLGKDADNADVEKIDQNDDGKLSIYAISQAVQVLGFDGEDEGPVHALNTAFAEVDEAYAEEIFADLI